MTEIPIIQKKYSVSEIDEMRELIKCNWFYDWSHSYDPAKRSIQIEEILRTYMMAGISIEEIEEEANRRIDENDATEKLIQKALAPKAPEDWDTSGKPPSDPGFDTSGKGWWKFLLGRK